MKPPETPVDETGNVATAIAEPPPAETTSALEPAPTPEPPAPEAKAEPAPAKPGKPGKPGRDVTGQLIKIAQLQSMSMPQLTVMAKDMAIENFGTMRKQELIYQILQENAKQSGILFAEGVLEILPEGYGFLRSQSFSYLPCPEDVYVSPSQIRRFDLQTGDLIAGQIRPP
ncbi:MAG TPA: Rho termination factor N-terminal domain-containing protein, partial [Verrucomicrobiae bacterium]